ncbi:MAG: hypothetical protein GF364_07980 [Candidatus Lokiarchaeota archaeon]|nr:hypothetical protein [Candidatus Lokiarchaeota archaeon]
MEKAIVLLSGILIFGFAVLTAQPEGFSYQAVVRDADGSAMKNQDVKIKINLLKGSAHGTVSYSEEHDITTNALGLVNLQIGNGDSLGGSMDTIPWGKADYYLETELDADGSGYTAMGTQQLISVPYAQHASTAGKLTEPLEQKGDTLFFSGGAYTVIQGLGQNETSIMKDPRDGQVYATVNIAGDWWMAENLNYYTDTGSVYYDNDSAAHAITYGRLYTWYMAMNGEDTSSSNPSGVQGICPPGWHLPSYAEWEEVINMYGGKDEAHKHFKVKGDIYWNNNSESDNLSGLSFLPGGYAFNTGSSFNEKNATSYTILSEEFTSSDCNLLWISYNIAYNFQDYKSSFYSVRCKKD